MRSLIDKTKKALRSKRGETLVEAIASMLILAILLTSVAAMIQTALRMSGEAVRDAAENQEAINNIILGHFDPANTRGAEINFTAPGIVASHEIEIYVDTTAGIIAFIPD